MGFWEKSALCKFEFFKFRRLKKIVLSDEKKLNIFCILKYYSYICNAGREQSPPMKQKSYKP